MTRDQDDVESSAGAPGTTHRKSIWKWVTEKVKTEWDILALIILLVGGSFSVDRYSIKPSNEDNWAHYAIAVLILLSITTLRLRGSSDAAKEASNAVRADVVRLIKTGSNAFLQLRNVAEQLTRPPLLEMEENISGTFLRDTSDLSISGITLGRTIPDSRAAIIEVLRRAGTVRVMITEFSEDREVEFPKRFWSSKGGRGEPITLRERLAFTRRHLSEIATEAVDLGYQGTLLLGELPFIAPCGLMIVKRESGTYLRCEIYQRTSPQAQIAFYLDSGMSEYAATLAPLEQTFEDYWEVAGEQDLTALVREDRRSNRSTIEKSITGKSTVEKSTIEKSTIQKSITGKATLDNLSTQPSAEIPALVEPTDLSDDGKR